jgi:hypothetical protein
MALNCGRCHELQQYNGSTITAMLQCRVKWKILSFQPQENPKHSNVWEREGIFFCQYKSTKNGSLIFKIRGVIQKFPKHVYISISSKYPAESSTGKNWAIYSLYFLPWAFQINSLTSRDTFLTDRKYLTTVLQYTLVLVTNFSIRSQ